MTNIHNILIGFCVAAASIGTLAQTSDEHKNHHPTGTTQSASATKESTGKPMNADKIASIDKQIKNMQAIADFQQLSYGTLETPTGHLT
jgi:hypothetical protein